MYFIRFGFIHCSLCGANVIVEMTWFGVWWCMFYQFWKTQYCTKTKIFYHMLNNPDINDGDVSIKISLFDKLHMIRWIFQCRKSWFDCGIACLMVWHLTHQVVMTVMFLRVVINLVPAEHSCFKHSLQIPTPWDTYLKDWVAISFLFWHSFWITVFFSFCTDTVVGDMWENGIDTTISNAVTQQFCIVD